MDALDAARAFIDQQFPECTAAFLAGSTLRGEATATSDLDIVIITPKEGTPYRESFLAFGWPIETFVHNFNSCLAYFASDASERSPSLPLMCVEGVILRDRDGTAPRIRDAARAILEQGPPPLNEADVARIRYMVTDALDDFIGTSTPGENYLIAGRLAEVAAQFLLAYHRQWSGDGKWLIRALKRFDAEKAQQLTTALERFYRQGSKDELVHFAGQVLEPVGGRLFEGYKAAGTVSIEENQPRSL